MGKNKKSKTSDNKRGYGIVNIEKWVDHKKDCRAIFRKTWDELSPLDIQKLVFQKYKVDDISKKFKVSPIAVLNKIRSK